MISILPFITLGYIVYKEGESILKQKIFNLVSNIADSKEKRIRNWFIERFNDTEMVAHNKFIEIYLSKLLEIKKEYKEKGLPPLKYTDTDEYKNILSFFNLIIYQLGQFSEIFILDTSGRIVVSNNKDHLMMDKSADDYFKIPMLQKEVYIKDVNYSEQLNQPIMTYSDIVYSAEGEEHGVAAGVVVAEVLVNNILSPMVEDVIGMGKSGETLLVNKNNITLLNLQNNSYKAMEYKLPPHTPAAMAIKGGSGIVEGIDYKGRQVLAAYRHIPDLDWGLVVKMDIEEAYAPITTLFKVIILLSLLGVSIILLLISRISKRITIPLIEMSMIADEISNGNYAKGYDYHLTRPDEIGDLGESIRKMSTALNKKYSEIEDYKRELELKVAEISEKNQNLEKTYHELNETKSYLEKTINHSKTLIITTNNSGNIVEFNPEAEERLGYKKKEVINKPATLLYQNPKEREEILFLLSKYGVVRNKEVSLLSKDGEIRNISLTISQLKNDAGEIIGTVGISKDITDEKVIQSKLIQSEKMAGIGTLASGIAHEVNNPLAGILGMAEAILDEDNPETIKSHGRDIVKYSLEATAIIRELLDYSHLTHSDSISTIELSTIMENSLKMAKHSTDFSLITVILDFKKDCWIKANSGEMQQVFVNLITNAAQAMEEKGGILKLTCFNSKHFVKASVADTGIGIKKDYLGQIYNPFFTTKPTGKGTGLGLYVTYNIIAKYKGSIEAFSEEGKGTSFSITFPISEKYLYI